VDSLCVLSEVIRIEEHDSGIVAPAPESSHRANLAAYIDFTRSRVCAISAPPEVSELLRLWQDVRSFIAAILLHDGDDFIDSRSCIAFEKTLSCWAVLERIKLAKSVLSIDFFGFTALLVSTTITVAVDDSCTRPFV
jgi:hypothetical protein